MPPALIKFIESLDPKTALDIWEFFEYWDESAVKELKDRLQERYEPTVEELKRESNVRALEPRPSGLDEWMRANERSAPKSGLPSSKSGLPSSRR